VTALLALWLTAATAPAPPPAQTLVEPVPEPTDTIWSVPIAHSAGVLVGMRLSLSVLWPDAYAPLPIERSGRQLRRSYSAPPEFRSERWLVESDGDPWSINVIGHGLFGAEVYGRLRQCGGSPWQSLAFAAGTSLVWEYGIESFHKQPSAVDLVVTPLLGAVLGEGRYQAQRWLRRKPRGFWRRFGEIVIDPLGEGERVFLKTRC
jgi:hypothetical protein